MIGRGTILVLGLSQLVCWGISYYLIGVFGEAIAADLGWSRTLVFGGFSAALLVMGLTSPLAGRLIDRFGGRLVMAAGSVAVALGCAALALSRTVFAYYAAWAWLGLAMRLTLYDAAFAALARIGGAEAKGPIAQITLLGGLASTTFWPIGHALAGAFGWRGAVLVYAGIALLTVPLHLAIREGRHAGAGAGAAEERAAPLAAGPREHLLAAGLYALIVTLVTFLNSGMSAHMIDLLAALGLGASLSVWVATLRGVGQSLARLCEVLFGRRLHPMNLNVIAASVLPLSFVAALFAGRFTALAVAFTLLYGVGNGLMTITRGTLPLALFDSRTYGAFVGRLLVPSFLLSAASPLAFAFAIERFGEEGALVLALAVALTVLAAALALKARFGPG